MSGSKLAQLLCLALLGAPILLFIPGNNLPESAERLPTTLDLTHPGEAFRTSVPTTAPEANAAATDLPATPAALQQSNPFKAYLEAHSNGQPSITWQEENPPSTQDPFREALKTRKPTLPLDDDPLATPNPFREALKNRQPYSTASPFATLRN